jgi:hypothetical protein
MLNPVSPSRTEEFALRILLRHFPAREWEDLRTHNGTLFTTFAGAALALGLVGNVNQNARICLDDAIIFNRPPSDIRFLLVLCVRNGADFPSLLHDYFGAMADDGDSESEVQVKINELMASFVDPYVDHAFVPPVSRIEEAIQ